jgi:hypothetical protein
MYSDTMGSLDINAREDDDTESNTAESTFFVTYNESSDQWDPSPSSSRVEIPTVPTDDIRTWASKRMTLVDVRMNGDKPMLDNQGFMIGKVCLPPSQRNCAKCGASSADAKLVALNDLKLRTYNGCILRKRFGTKCMSCSGVVQWDPASEHILTIRDGREGGKSPLPLFLVQ